MPFQIRVADTSLSFACREDQTVLAAMSEAGERCVLVGCRSGGCGVCRVQVAAGAYETGTMSREQIDEQDLARGEVLSCQLYPRSDLTIVALGRPQAGDGNANFSIFRNLMVRAA